MTDPFRLAVVGVDHPHGAAWRELLLNLAEQVEIVAIVPRYGGGLTSLEERFAETPRYEEVDDLVRGGGFDGALVCLPNDEGPAAIVRLAEAGKHVLVEKPAAGHPREARLVVDAVRRAGVAFQCGYMWRYDEGANRLRAMVGEGRFGRLTSVEMTFVTSDVARRGPQHYLFDADVSQAGFFNWLGCHQLDLLLYVTGRAVVGVCARVGVYGGTPVNVEDGGAAILELEGGALATLVGGYWLPRWAGESRWALRGSERWVHWDPARRGTSGVLEVHGPQPQWHAMEEVFELPADNVCGYGGCRGLALVQDWLDAARAATPGCRNSPEGMLATLELIEAIYESSRTGRRVECRIEPA